MAAFYEEAKRNFIIKNPVTREEIGSVKTFSEKDIDETVACAKAGFKIWSKFTQFKRNELIKKFVALYTGRIDELALLLCKEMGKPLAQARGEFGSLTALSLGYCEKARHDYGICFQSGAEETKGVKDIVFTRREPLGVVVSVLPFNYPIDLFGQKVMPALVAGNSVIVKPPSDCPLTICKVVEIMHEAGIPPNAAQVVTGSGKMIGDYLAGHKGIQAISLTGSTETGIQIYQKAAVNLTRVFLECGGNDAFIVRNDANVELAVKEAMASRCGNAGQICCASKRFIVHKNVAADFTQRLLEGLKTVKQGNPLDPAVAMGSLINEKAAIDTEKQVALTVSQGAKCILGGKRFDDVFFPPTILTGVTAQMDVAKDLEIFAPVFPIIEFSTDEEALAIANQSSYGLMGAVFTEDYRKGLQMCEQLEAGGVVLNGHSTFRMAEQPFGGYKKSGIGREGISRTLDEYTQEKTYALKGVFA
jgi:succinate-semialdehyde dehydrogenase/glutarate-semialdehyde dehydrogenase